MAAQLIELQAPEKIYKPVIGDVLWDARKWLTKLPLVPWTPSRWGEVIQLDLIHENPWTALRVFSRAAATVLIADSRYCCPYTGYQHFGIVPSAVVSKNAEQYRERIVVVCGPDPVVLDFEWHRALPRRPENEPSDIQRLLLGSGYTSRTNKSDGHGKLKMGYVCLSNGDMLRVHFWEWYNK